MRPAAIEAKLFAGEQLHTLPSFSTAFAPTHINTRKETGLFVVFILYAEEPEVVVVVRRCHVGCDRYPRVPGRPRITEHAQLVHFGHGLQAISVGNREREQAKCVSIQCAAQASASRHQSFGRGRADRSGHAQSVALRDTGPVVPEVLRVVRHRGQFFDQPASDGGADALTVCHRVHMGRSPIPHRP